MKKYIILVNKTASFSFITTVKAKDLDHLLPQLKYIDCISLDIHEMHRSDFKRNRKVLSGIHLTSSEL